MQTLKNFTKSFSKIIIISQNLASQAGHDFNYACSISDAAEEQDVQAYIFASKEFTQSIKDNIKPHFSTIYLDTSRFRSKPIATINCAKIVEPLRKALSFLTKNYSIFCELVKLRDFACVDDNILFLVPTFRLTEILGIYLYTLLPFKGERLLVAVNHYSYQVGSGCDYLSSWLASLVYACLSSYKSRSLVIATDSRSLAISMQNIYHHPIYVLPIPHVHNQDMLTTSDASDHSHYSIGFFGLGNEAKGFHKLPLIVAISKESLLKSTNFILQANIDVSNDKLVKAANELSAIHSVDLLRNDLSSADYYIYLNSTDIVLFPYDPGQYRFQTSGVFSEARALGKVVLVQKDTWLHEEVNAYGGGLACDFDKQDSILKTFNVIAQDYVELKQQAVVRAPTWSQKHSAKGFLNELSLIWQEHNEVN